jgi:hypothetical protein
MRYKRDEAPAPAFIDATLVPDIILLENEGSDGFLIVEISTGHFQGDHACKVSDAKADQELCGQILHCHTSSYPRLGGFCKAETTPCNEIITAAGLLRHHYCPLRPTHPRTIRAIERNARPRLPPPRQFKPNKTTSSG